MPIGPRTKILDKIKKTAPKDGLFLIFKSNKKDYASERLRR